MALILTYTDAYLKQRITSSIEQRAFDEVDAVGAFADDWRDKLAVIRAYILTCLEFGGEQNDTFSVKLSQYRREWDFSLALARASSSDTSSARGLHSLTIERS